MADKKTAKPKSEKLEKKNAPFITSPHGSGGKLPPS